MHHLTTLNLPTMQGAADNRAWLAKAVADFEANGGVIQQCAIRTGGEVSRKWNDAGALVIATGPSAEDEELAKLIRNLADKGAGITAIKYHLRIDARRIKRLARAYGIEIKSQHPGAVAGPGKANRDATAERGRKNRQAIARQAMPMIEAGDSMNTIAKALHCSKQTLARAIEEQSEA